MTGYKMYPVINFSSTVQSVFLIYFVDRAPRYKLLLMTNLKHFFTYLFIYFISLHVSRMCCSKHVERWNKYMKKCAKLVISKTFKVVWGNKLTNVYNCSLKKPWTQNYLYAASMLFFSLHFSNPTGPLCTHFSYICPRTRVRKKHWKCCQCKIDVSGPLWQF
jgi:hypothetical protein